MKQTIKTVFLLLFLMTNWVSAQTDPAKDAVKLERGEEIINQARRAIDKDNILQNLRSIYLNIDKSSSGVDFSSEISILMPDKIRVDSILAGFRTIKVSNGGKYSEDSEMSINGEPLSMKSIGAPSPKMKFPAFLEDVLSDERIEYLKKNPDELKKVVFMGEDLWRYVFPILLSNPLNTDVKYEYVGKAESANRRADIVDVKSDFYRKIRLFFDENTHLLLMMTEELDSKRSVFTERYYFSDYQPTSGLLIAKSVKKESDEVFKDGSGKKTYNSPPPVIKEIKINPNLKSGVFAH